MISIFIIILGLFILVVMAERLYELEKENKELRSNQS